MWDESISGIEPSERHAALDAASGEERRILGYRILNFDLRSVRIVPGLRAARLPDGQGPR